MQDAPRSLPDNVIAAIERGNLVEAIKLLRDTTGFGLKECKDALDAYMSGKPVSIQVRGTPPRGDAFPPSVGEALQRGDKIEAIRRMREQTGLGLKEAKEAVELAQEGMGVTSDGLSPGEVGRSGGALGWIAVVVVAAILGYFAFRNLL